jgi:hypothetical protein
MRRKVMSFLLTLAPAASFEAYRPLLGAPNHDIDPTFQLAFNFGRWVLVAFQL